jgi:hypothetical protein
MTMDRRSFLLASSSALAFGGSRRLLAPRERPADTSGPPHVDRLDAREVAVYVTAEKTDYRISPTD